MEKLQAETREQAVARFNRDGGNERDYIRSFPVKGSNATLTICQICNAHLEDGVIKHLYYCPFEGAADRLKAAAPAMLAALTEPIQNTLTVGPDFAADIEHDATILEMHGYNVRADALRAKAQAIRAAISASHPLGAKSLEGIADTRGGGMMQVDTTAFMQGVINARTEHAICQELAEQIFAAVRPISYRGHVGRSVCDYDKLLIALAGIEAEWIEWSLMWKHLGEWLSSGITVGSVE